MLSTKDLFDLLARQVSEVNQLWTFYSVIVLGVLGFVYKEADLRRSLGAKVLLSLGFAAFAVGNYASLIRNQEVARAIVAQLKGRRDPADALLGDTLSALNPMSLAQVRWYHFVISLLVLAAILLAPRPTSQTTAAQSKLAA